MKHTLMHTQTYTHNNMNVRPQPSAHLVDPLYPPFNLVGTSSFAFEKYSVLKGCALQSLMWNSVQNKMHSNCSLKHCGVLLNLQHIYMHNIPKLQYGIQSPFIHSLIPQKPLTVDLTLDRTYTGHGDENEYNAVAALEKKFSQY